MLRAILILIVLPLVLTWDTRMSMENAAVYRTEVDYPAESALKAISETLAETPMETVEVRIFGNHQFRRHMFVDGSNSTISTTKPAPG